jgi:polyhydroxyalkanoate synthesis regulator phasin
MARKFETKFIKTPEIVEAFRNVFFAFLGAAVLSAEEAEKVFEKLVGRGEQAQKDFQRRLGDFQNRAKKNVEDIQSKVNENFQRTLKRFGVVEGKTEEVPSEKAA